MALCFGNDHIIKLAKKKKMKKTINSIKNVLFTEPVLHDAKIILTAFNVPHFTNYFYTNLLLLHEHKYTEATVKRNYNTRYKCDVNIILTVNNFWVTICIYGRPESLHLI